MDPEIRAPYSDEYSIGVDREMPSQLAVTMAYVRKNGANYIGYEEVGGQYSQQTRSLPDGSTVPVLRAHECDGRSSLPPDESGGILTDLQRPRRHDRKAPVTRLAGVRLLHVLARRGAAGIEWNGCRQVSSSVR